MAMRDNDQTAGTLPGPTHTDGSHPRHALLPVARHTAGPGVAGTQPGTTGAGQVVRAAFAGRTSTEDQQDPTISLPRQLRACTAALPAKVVIATHFYDVESGRTDLAARGHGRAHERFAIPVPRDGGIADLLAEAQQPDRRFDVVICESIDRIARRTYYGTLIEHTLEQAGVPLLAADEPISLNKKRATQVLTRRVKQGIAEWYVLEMLEKSWGGFCEHTEQGYNIGKPPYGYLAEKIPHPVPARRAEGKTKHRLAPDPDRSSAVAAVFAWRVGLRLGYKAIAAKLNADLATYPPPQPVDPRRAVGKWTQSSVYEILHNPKYTGYMVWNRRATKRAHGKVNPVAEWVWSSQPTHDALVSREIFLAAWTIAEHRERSRTATTNTAHPQTKRTYRLRTYLFCAHCERRMFGKTRRNTAYYACQPAGPAPEGHPKSLWVPEHHLITGLTQFFSTRILGEHRRDLLAAQLSTAATDATTDHDNRIAALRRTLTEVETRRTRLLRQLELTDDPDGELGTHVRHRLAELRAEQDAATTELRDLEHAPAPTPTPALLDALPAIPLDLARIPDQHVRAIFEAFRLQIHYDRTTNTAHCQVTLTTDTLPAAHASLTSATSSHPASGSAPAVPICSVPPAGAETDLRRRVRLQRRVPLAR